MAPADGCRFVARRMIIRLGKHLGFRTLNVVRRRETAEELLRAGSVRHRFNEKTMDEEGFVLRSMPHSRTRRSLCH